ncbi:MAG: beta strand repeat-containing protein, partial [Flammeovirgaceae bacterium]
MKKHSLSFLQQRYRKLYQKLQKFQARFQKALLRSALFPHKLASMQKRLLKYQQQLTVLGRQLKLAGASLAVGLTLTTHQVEAQQRTVAFNNRVFNPFNLLDITRTNQDPTFADLDGDGDLDALIGEEDGTIQYLQNTGDAHNPTFATAVDNPFGLTDVGSRVSPAFADLDGDGDLDGFVGNGAGTISYFENTGDANNPTFVTTGTNPFGSLDFGQNAAPTFADTDGDGDLDAYIGRVGSVTYFENTGDATNPDFQFITSNIFGPTLIVLSANPSFADVDEDGDLDILLGIQYDDVYYFENTGDATNPAFTASGANPFGSSVFSGNAAPALADIDGDGDIDAFVGTYDAIQYFANTGTFTQHTFRANIRNPFNLRDVGSRTSPNFVDIDSDGDLDMFVGDLSGRTFYFQNTGNATNPTFASSVTNPFGLTDIGMFSTPTFVDIDGDGDLDAFVGEYDDNMNFFQNTGDANNPTFAAVIQDPFGLDPILYNYAPTFADIDGDGDLDAFIGEAAGNITYFRNTGNVTNPTFVSAGTNPFGLTNEGLYSSASFADIDGDGDLDAFVGVRDGNTHYFENTGNATNPTFAAAVQNPFGWTDVGNYSTPAFVDIDGDGDLDAFAGETIGDINFFRAVKLVTWTGTWSNSTGPTANDKALIDADFDINTDGDISAFDIEINSGHTLTMTSGNISVRGDFTNNGNTFTQTAGTFTFNGAETQNISGTNSFDDLVINNSARVILNDATDVTGVLTLTNGTLRSNGNLTLKSTAVGAGGTATISFGSGTISGNITQERFLDGAAQQGYRYISTGLNGVTIAAIDDDVTVNRLGSTYSPGTNESTYRIVYNDAGGLPNLFYYDQSLVGSGTITGGYLDGESFDQAKIGWEIPSATTTAFNPGDGLALNITTADVTLDFTGTLQSSNAVLSLPHGGQTNSGWQLIGNPFVATLDWDAVFSDGDNSGVDPTAYVFNADGEFSGSYATYNAFTNASVNGGVKDIASGQAFFIQTTSGMTGDVTLKTTHTSSTDVTFSRTMEDTPAWQGELRLQLTDLQQDRTDELLLYFIDGATDEKDFGDAKKFFGDAWGLPELASQAYDTDLLMDCRAPLDEELQSYAIAVKSGQAGRYQLSATTIAQFAAGTEIYLEDLWENRLINLNEQQTYEFELAEAGKVVENRFVVHMRINQITSLLPESLAANVTVFAANQQVHIQFEPEFAKSNIAIYDLTGRQIIQLNNESDLGLQIPI